MKRKSKLTLHRETVAQLDRSRLDQAVGGLTHIYGTSCCPTGESIRVCTDSCQSACWGCPVLSEIATECDC